MNLPITVNLTLENNKTSFEIKQQKIPTYDLEVGEPITVELKVDSSKRVFAMALESNQHDLELSNATAIIVQSGGDVPYYDGEYLVIPHSKNETILQTKNKKCRDNITVTKIQTARTTNPYGTTFYIAEVE